MHAATCPAYAVDFARVTGVGRYLQQIRAMFVKMALHACRNVRMSLAQIVTPVFFVCCACAIIWTLPMATDLPPLYLDLSQYRGHVVVPYLSAPNSSTGQIQRLASGYRDVIVAQVRSHH